MSKRVVFVVKAGDFGKAYDRLDQGGEEFYANERAGIDAMRRLGEIAGHWVMLNGMTDEAYQRALTPSLTAVGLGCNARDFEAKAIAWLNEYKPTHLILGSPMPGLMDWAIAQRDEGMQTLPLWADTFFGGRRTGPIKQRLKTRLGKWRWTRRLSQQLKALKPTLAINHNANASWQLVKLGVPAENVVPYEVASPLDASAQTLPVKAWTPGTTFRLQYVGTVSEQKGVGDLIRAVGLLKQRGRDVTASIVGVGDIESLKDVARSCGAETSIVFEGRRAREQVLEMMQSASASVVPSRPLYPEGLPLTLYEALGVRTPLIASDHPAWDGRLVPDHEACIFKAEHPEDLANTIEKLMNDPALYQRLSENGPATHKKLCCAMTVHKLLEHYTRDHEEDRKILREHSLASGRYGPPPKRYR